MTLSLQSAVKNARILQRDFPALIGGHGRFNVLPGLKDIALKKSEERGGPSSVLIGQTETECRGGLHGYIIFRDVTPVILVHKRETKCWTRFSVTKELLHLYMGCTANGESINDRLMLAQDCRKNLPNNDISPIDDETYCFYMAIELMLPWAHRDELSDMNANNEPPLEMAKRFMIPLQIIKHYFEGEYGARSFRINRGLDI